MCLGYWSKLRLVSLEDLKVAASLPDATGKEDEAWPDDGWGIII